eukprot:Clim_evm18s191 gene=Clim_evmTU18s191
MPPKRGAATASRDPEEGTKGVMDLVKSVGRFAYAIVTTDKGICTLAMLAMFVACYRPGAFRSFLVQDSGFRATEIDLVLNGAHLGATVLNGGVATLAVPIFFFFLQEGNNLQMVRMQFRVERLAAKVMWLSGLVATVTYVQFLPSNVELIPEREAYHITGLAIATVFAYIGGIFFIEVYQVHRGKVQHLLEEVAKSKGVNKKTDLQRDLERTKYSVSSQAGLYWLLMFGSYGLTLFHLYELGDTLYEHDCL